MIDVRETDDFSDWLVRLGDARAKAKITLRVQRLRFGHLGDCKSVGDGVSELRITEGKGYRVYFVRRGNEIIVLLCGGHKGTQARDIVRAKELARQL